MALWGNSDAITVIDDSTVSMAYTSANSGLEAAAGIGSTAWVLTGTISSFGNPGYAKTGDIISVGFPKNSLGVGTYYGEGVIVAIANTTNVTIASTEGFGAFVYNSDGSTGISTIYQVRESPIFTQQIPDFSNNPNHWNTAVPSFTSQCRSGTASTNVGVGTSAVKLSFSGVDVWGDPATQTSLQLDGELIVGTDHILNNSAHIEITGVGTFIIGAGSSSAVGFQTVYIDTTQWPGIDPDNDGKIIVNNAAYDITSIAATSVSFASTLPQEILKGDGVLCSDNTILGLKSGVTAGISTSDTVKIQRLTGGYDKHVYSVDNTLVGLATDASGVSGVDTGKYRTSAGWVGVTTYLDNRGELRVKKEVLVAMSGITTGNYPLYDGDAWGAVDPEL